VAAVKTRELIKFQLLGGSTKENAHVLVRTALAGIPLHAVETEQKSVTVEQTQPHEDIASALVAAWHENERNCIAQQQPNN
jgi:hypothetical protein